MESHKQTNKQTHGHTHTDTRTHAGLFIIRLHNSYLFILTRSIQISDGTSNMSIRMHVCLFFMCNQFYINKVTGLQFHDQNDWDILDAHNIQI